MKKLGILLIVLLSFTFCKTHKSIYNKNIINTSLSKKENFPKNWIGNYQGELQIYSVDSIKMTAQMKLQISQKTDSLYNWTIIYNINGKKDIRSYELQIIDIKQGHYIIDEKNSIKIDAFYHNKIFTSFFKVMDSYIVASYTKKDNTIIFEIISASNKKTTTTGNTNVNEEKIPEVTTYFVKGRQKAVLKYTN
jgi:hypothetical protein